MALKRKRSTATISPLSSSISASASERESSQSPTPLTRAIGFSSSGENDINIAENAIPQQIDHWADITPRHLHSRTRKRFRDSRPEESVLYKNTFEKLFAAQQQQRCSISHSVPITTPSLPRSLPSSISPSPSTSTHRSTPQPSLNAFWPLPRRPYTSRAFNAPASATTDVRNCEDCDAALAPADALDVEMGGTDAESEYACRGCGREVCGMCAVVGDGRVCLECATSGRGAWGMS
ncbi:hypothetical protein MMC16_004142 [Acarospora aff. strigata]|nr:hypothetical protein [Acarospora aff. strigata]